MKPLTSVLVVSGIDPGGGAGLAIDLAFLSRLAVRGAPVASCLTVQDDRAVQRVEPIDAELLTEMIAAAVRSLGNTLRAIKIGLVPSPAIAERLAEIARELRLPLVCDPILLSGTGHALHHGDPYRSIRPLFEVATLVTPNIREAEMLADRPWDKTMTGLLDLARRLAGLNRTVAITGGQAPTPRVPLAIAGPEGEALIEVDRVPISNTHGTGCALSASAAGYLALGIPEQEAVIAAHRFVAACLTSSRGVPGGRISPEPWHS